MRLQSFSSHIVTPENWGVYNNVFSKNLTSSIRKVVMKVPSMDIVKEKLKEETQFRGNLFRQNEPILPSNLFIHPSELIITRLRGKPLFPEKIPDEEEEIQPKCLPFDITLLKKDIESHFQS